MTTPAAILANLITGPSPGQTPLRLAVVAPTLALAFERAQEVAGLTRTDHYISIHRRRKVVQVGPHSITAYSSTADPAALRGPIFNAAWYDGLLGGPAQDHLVMALRDAPGLLVQSFAVI